MTFLPEKLKAAVEVLLARPRIPAPGGLDELCRALWYADALIARQRGQSLTGCSYVMRANTPYTRSLAWAIDVLCAEGAIAGCSAGFLSYTKADLKVVRALHADALDEEELRALEEAHEAVFPDRFGGGRLACDDFRERMLSAGRVGLGPSFP